MSAFLRAAGEGERRRLIGHGLGLLRVADRDRAGLTAASAAWSPYGDASVDEFARRFVRDTMARFARARADAEPRFLGNDEDYVADRGVVPVFEARQRRPRRDAKPRVLDAIGYVPQSMEKKTPRAPDQPRAKTLDDSLLARLDAVEAEHAARVAEIMARVDASHAQARQRLVETVDDHDEI